MEEKKPAASPDPAEQVEELLAQARQTAAGRVSRREMDAILESVRSQGAPEPSGAKRVRQGKTAPDEQDLIPEPEELSLPEQRRQTARQFFGAMFLTLILLGGVFGALLVEESYRRVGMGSLPTQVFSARLTEEVSANHGRAQYNGAILREGPEGLEALPIRGKSGLITTLAGADGYFCIPRDCEGFPAGARIPVHLFTAD